MKPGWRGCRASAIAAGSPSKLLPSLCSSDADGLTLRSRAEDLLSTGEDGGEATMPLLPLPLEGPAPGGASLKTWTVSVAEETQRRVDVALKLM